MSPIDIKMTFLQIFEGEMSQMTQPLFGCQVDGGSMVFGGGATGLV
jgi:hypothetical protein